MQWSRGTTLPRAGSENPKDPRYLVGFPFSLGRGICSELRPGAQSEVCVWPEAPRVTTGLLTQTSLDLGARGGNLVRNSF